MVVHRVHVQSQDIRLEEWSIDTYTYCYLDLCKDVFDEILGTKYAQWKVEVKTRAHIKGGEYIITVDSDKSLMDMFEQNRDRLTTMIFLWILGCWYIFLVKPNKYKIQLILLL